MTLSLNLEHCVLVWAVVSRATVPEEAGSESLLTACLYDQLMVLVPLLGGSCVYVTAGTAGFFCRGQRLGWLLGDQVSLHGCIWAGAPEQGAWR